MSIAVSDPLDVETIRQDFPILQTILHDQHPLIYFDNAASTQVPRQVLDTFVHLYEHSYANVHRGIHSLSEQATEAYEQARQKVANFLNAPSEQEIVFTGGTTDGVNLVAQSWGGANLQPEDEILLSELEHHSNHVPWLQIAERTGAKLKFIPITEDGRIELPAVAEALSPKTKLIAITALSNTLGTIVPLPEIIAMAHRENVPVFVDAAQSVPHSPTDVQKLDCDFLVFSGHKMVAPGGIGVLYAKREHLEAMPPYRGGGSMIRIVQWDHFTPAEPPLRFEAGTPSIAPAIALGAATDYLQAIGLDRIAAHERALTQRAYEGLQSLEGIRLLGPPPEQRGGLVTFVFDAACAKDFARVPHADDYAKLLDDRGIAVRAGHHCTMPLHQKLGISASVRASFYFYNSKEEVERLIESVDRIQLRSKQRKKSSRFS